MAHAPQSSLDPDLEDLASASELYIFNQDDAYEQAYVYTMLLVVVCTSISISISQDPKNYIYALIKYKNKYNFRNSGGPVLTQY